MQVRILGRGFATKRGADRLVARGVARRIGNAIAMIEDDYRVDATPVSSGMNGSTFQQVNLGPVIAQPNIVDAFEGHPVLWTIGYDRRTPGSYQKAA